MTKISTFNPLHPIRPGNVIDFEYDDETVRAIVIETDYDRDPDNVDPEYIHDDRITFFFQDSDGDFGVEVVRWEEASDRITVVNDTNIFDTVVDKSE